MSLELIFLGRVDLLNGNYCISRFLLTTLTLFSTSDSLLIDGVLLLKYFLLLTIISFFGVFLIVFDSILIYSICFSNASFFLSPLVDFTGVFLRLNSLLLLNLPLSWILSKLLFSWLFVLFEEKARSGVHPRPVALFLLCIISFV